MTTKQYLRFAPASVFGVIGSSTAKILQLSCYKINNTVAVPACEDVILWNLQTKHKCLVLKGESSYVTCLISDSSCTNIAVGYGDGIIRVFDSISGNCTVSFLGHKSAVSCLSYNEDNSNLASGGKDSEIVVWDVTLEAGLFRFKGHKGPITKCHFLKGRNILISSSKDTYIKFWDLETQRCFQTLVGNRYEILDFVVIKGTRLITGLNELSLNVWDLSPKDGVYVNEGMKKMKLGALENEVMSVEIEQIDKDNVDNDDADEIFECVQIGKLEGVGRRTVSIVIDERERLLGFHGSTKTLQLYKILNPEEISKRLRKRKRKEDMKKEKEGEDQEDQTLSSEITASPNDEFQLLPAIQTNAKIDSFSIIMQQNDAAKITVLMKNNTIFQYEFDFKRNDSAAVLCHQLLHPGHRSTVTSLNYSGNSSSIFSVSFESARIWKNFQDEEVCCQAIDCNFALSSVFISAKNQCIIGTRNGELQIFDTDSQQLLENVEAHDGAVNCLCEAPDKYGVTSGSKDKNIKFWSYELVQDETFSQKRKLSLSLKRTLQMPGEIVCLKYSPDQSKIAVSMDDNTVQVLFVDSLKLAFSLYGHILPVTCMDISYDSTLIATGSEDKDIRLWSMEFGSCIKFIEHAHDKGLTCLRFLPRTHLFFTGGKDHLVKQWDADNFQKITTLKGHQSEVTAMTVSPDGVTLVTASQDKSIRKWQKTNEPLVLSEEQEKEREEEEEEIEDLPPVPGEVNKEFAFAGLKTAETIKSVDQLIEAIDIYKEEVFKIQEHEIECKKTGKELPPPARHPLLIAYSTTCPVRYMRKALNKIKSSELQGALLLLPFSYVLEFLKILCEFADRKWDTELCVRCSTFLVRIHMGQMLLSQNFKPVIERLNEKLFPQIHALRDTIGFAKVACQIHLHAIEAIDEVPVFTGVLQDVQQRRKKSKKKQRTFVTLT